MFCSNCGNKIEEGGKYCGQCGKAVAQGDSSQDSQESTTLPGFATTSRPQYTYVKRKNPLPLIIVLIVALIGVSALVYFKTNIFVTSPEKVVAQFFKAIQDEDTSEFLSLLDKHSYDSLKEDIEYYGEKGKTFNQNVKIMLERMNGYLSEEYGKSWPKKVKIKKADIYEDEATVIIEMEDEEDYIGLTKVKGKWKIAINGMF